MLKTLGATRGHIASIFSIEFAVLGLVAGLVGVVFADIVVRVLLKLLNVPSSLQWGLEPGGAAADRAADGGDGLAGEPQDFRSEAA